MKGEAIVCSSIELIGADWVVSVGEMHEGEAQLSAEKRADSVLPLVLISRK